MSALAARQREILDAIYGTQPAGEWEPYRGNSIANLHDSLAATYPVVRRLVGEAFFAEAASRFTRAAPSRSGDLHDYGRGFAAFLEGYPHARGLAYLGDVARLEWACHESHGAADVASFDASSLAAIAPDSLAAIVFSVHPAVRLVRSRHAIASIWLANQPPHDGTVLHDGAEDALVSRGDENVRVRAAEPMECALLAAFLRGAALGEAIEGFDPATLARSLGPALARFAAEGIVCGFVAPRTGA